MQKFIVIIFLVLGVSFLSTASKQKNEVEKYYKLSQKISEEYNAGNYSGIWKRFDKKSKLALKEKSCITVFKGFKKDLGEIKSIDKTPIIKPEYYAFTVHFEKAALYQIIKENENNKLAMLAYVYALPVVYPEITKELTIDELINAYFKSKAAVGLVAGVYNKGKVKTYFHGVKDKKTEQKPDKNTLFEIGSITKTLTAIATLELQEQGKIDIDAPIQEYLPENVKVPVYNGKKILVKNLLLQNSGLPRLPDNFWGTVKDELQPYENYTVKDFYDFLNNYKMTRAPGAEYEYSNFGFGLLGHILSLVSGKTYSQVMQDEIFSKLGMNDTVFNISSKLVHKTSTVYNLAGEKVKMWKFKAFAGCGAIKSDLSDMMKYLKANINPPNDILGKVILESHKVQFKPKGKEFEQAFAWLVMDMENRKIVFHDGGTYGSRSVIVFCPEEKIGVVIMSNSGLGVESLGLNILKLLLIQGIGSNK